MMHAVTGTDGSEHVRYPALDGLRAVAMAAVLFYHGGYSQAAGGYAGVDLFLVLSGFLITGVLWRERERTGRVGLRRFWGKRFRRLAPALLVVVAAVAVGSAVLADTSRLSTIRSDALSALFYYANWQFVLGEQSYFDQFADPSPLRHAWTLAVEEQWYVVWPLVFAAAARMLARRPRLFVTVLGALAGLSAAWMAALHVPGLDPSRAYYGTDTRAQTLLVGAALGVALRDGVRRRRLVAAAGAVAVPAFAAFVVLSGDIPWWMFEGGFLVLAVVCAAAVAGAVVPGPVSSVLSWGPLTAMGRATYSMYLWHWPVFVAMTPQSVGIDGHALFAARTAVAVALTVVTYHAVECPLREGRLVRPRLRAPVFAGATAATVVVALVATVPSGERTVTLADMAVGEPAEQLTARSATRPGDVRKPRVMVAGDSSGLTLAYHSSLAREHVAPEGAVLLGCAVTRGDGYVNGRRVSANPECETWRNLWRRQVSSFDPDYSVVLMGAWEVIDRNVDGNLLTVYSDEYRRYVHDELWAGLDILTSHGGKAAVLRVPCFQEPDREIDSSARPRNDPERVAWVNGIVEDVVAAHPSRPDLLDLSGLLCPGGRYLHEIDGAVVRDDGVHFTPHGAGVVWRWMLGEMLDDASAVRDERG